MKPEDIRAYLEAKHSPERAPVPPPDVAFREARAPGEAAARDERLYESISKSYLILRRGLALLAIAMPILLLLGVGLDNVQPSISAYYHFRAGSEAAYGSGTMRDFFVGILWAIGTFLYFYKGYSREEDRALDVAGLAALGVALFPMSWTASDTAPAIFDRLHSASAIIFFLAIAYVCLFRSKDTLEILKEPHRGRFKLGYRILGTLMIVLPAAVLAAHLLSPPGRSRFPVLLIEIAGIYVFATFWLVKSREIALIEKQ